MRKTRKKLLAVLLAFTMLFGSSMTVLAREIECKDLNENAVLTEGDSIILSQEVKDDRYAMDLEHSITIHGTSSGNNNDSGMYSGGDFKLTVSVPTGKQWTIDTKNLSPFPDGTNHPYKYTITVHETDAVPSSNPTTPSSDSKEPTKMEPAHVHSLSWVETVEPSETTDGLMEYKCSCGYVEEKSVISGSMSFVKNLVRQIETAPENSTAEIKTEYFTCYTAYIMNALKKRPDVSLKTTFKDYDKDGSIKTFTIPAGKAPDDKELFYGFTYLGNLYGWDE